MAIELANGTWGSGPFPVPLLLAHHNHHTRSVLALGNAVPNTDSSLGQSGKYDREWVF
jgi:hypothetical protein